jgi:1,2-phenylacetyl-CoA epoxidase catalytic subunit
MSTSQTRTEIVRDPEVEAPTHNDAKAADEPLDPNITAGLANLVMVVGDNKHWLGQWLSEWSVGAPGLESAVAAAAIAQGEFGQARALLPFANKVIDGDIGAPGTRSRRYNVAALDDGFESWAEAVVTLLLVDPALNLVLSALQQTQPELERRIGRVLEESQFYTDFARGRLVELTESWEHGRSQAAPHVHPILIEMLCWFGPPGEPGVQLLNEAGVLTLDNDAMRQAYLDEVVPVLRDHGYELPVTGGPGDWTLTEDLPWERWNALQRRLDT